MEKEAQAPVVVGIDLGTTYTRVAVWKDNHVEVIENSYGHRMTPSYVAFTSTQRFIGDAAKNRATINTANTVFDTKRLIGRRFKDASVQDDIRSWPFEVIPSEPCDRPMIVVSYKDEEKKFTAEQISSMVLMKMKETAEAYLGTSVQKAVVTVPAYFNNTQRQATLDACHIAGLIVRLMNEPTAAALAYAKDKMTGTGEEKNILIFDLGGGTFDVSIITIKGKTITVNAVAGDTHLGGEDFDKGLVDHFVGEFKRNHGNDDISLTPKALRKLRKACEEAKKNLSFVPHFTISVDSLHDEIDFNSTITRDKFEEINGDLFNKCMQSVEECLKDANMDKSRIDDVVLVGGSTRMPKVQFLLREMFNGKQLCKSINPDEAVVYGAAVQAAMLSEVPPLQWQCLDITPRSSDFSEEMFRLSEEEIKRMAVQACRCKAEDEKYNRMMETKNALENSLHQAKNDIMNPEIASIIPMEDKKRIEEAIGSNIERLEANQHAEYKEIEELVLEIQSYKKKVEAKNALIKYLDQTEEALRNGNFYASMLPNAMKEISDNVTSTRRWLENHQNAEAQQFENKKDEIEKMVLHAEQVKKKVEAKEDLKKFTQFVAYEVTNLQLSRNAAKKINDAIGSIRQWLGNNDLAEINVYERHKNELFKMLETSKAEDEEYKKKKMEVQNCAEVMISKLKTEKIASFLPDATRKKLKHAIKDLKKEWMDRIEAGEPQVCTFEKTLTEKLQSILSNPMNAQQGPVTGNTSGCFHNYGSWFS